MSYFEDGVQIDQNIRIRGVAMPETSVPVQITVNTVSDGGRLADNIDFEGSRKGDKVTIELKYDWLNKEHYDMLFNATIGYYRSGGAFFFDLTVPTYTPEGVQTYTVYFMSSHVVACVDTTEKHGLGAEYQQGGELYDELHKDVVFSFVQK